MECPALKSRPCSGPNQAMFRLRGCSANWMPLSVRMVCVPSAGNTHDISQYVRELPV